MLMIDDYNRMTSVNLLKKKSKEECFRIYKEMVEIETVLNIKCLILDNSREFTSNAFQHFFEEI